MPWRDIGDPRPDRRISKSLDPPGLSCLVAAWGIVHFVARMDRLAVVRNSLERMRCWVSEEEEEVKMGPWRTLVGRGEEWRALEV